MAKSFSTKSKPPPWIPPGKTSYRIKQPTKPLTKNKNVDDISPTKTTDVPKHVDEASKDDKFIDDLISISSTSSYEQSEPNIHLYSIFQEMKLLYTHFASLKTSYLSVHRLIDSQDIDDISINELLSETGVYVKDLNELFDDLEFSVSVLENTLDDKLKTLEYSKVFICKEKLLSKLLDMYEKIIIVFQTIFENQDVKGMSQKQESLNKKFQLAEKKCISQEAIITDLERKLSIYQSKTNAMESYKTNLENDKEELQKQLSFKESQIKYLSNELMNTSVKQTKSNHEELIEIIENIKSKAHSDKSALKKALKFQKAQIKENEDKFQKQLQETNEKERMMFDIAAQRDQLKIQLTVLNNNIVQQKSQIEELKIQNMKLQNEIAEKDLSCKKETNEIQNTLDEKLTLLDKALKTKKNLEETVEELETQLEKCKKQMKNLKEEMETTKPKDLPKQSDPEMLEEIHRLTSLLQSTKEAFENFKLPSNSLSAGGDQTVNDLQASSIQTEILEAVKETREHLLELKNLYKTLSQVEKGNQNPAKKNDSEKQVKKLEHLYEASVKENQALKAEIEEMKNALASTVQKTENYFTANMPSDNFTRKLQLELMKKSDEILKMTYDFQQKEKYLENQLREFKDKAKTLEIDRMKLSNLEEELKTNKLELSVLQQKKEEETERLLQRTKELQNSFDIKSAEFESLQRYVQLLKSSYFNVFGGS